MTKQQSSKKNKSEKASKKVRKMHHFFSLKMSAASMFCMGKGGEWVEGKGRQC